MQYGVCMQMSEFTGKKFWGGQETWTSFLLGTWQLIRDPPASGQLIRDPPASGSLLVRFPPYEIPSLWDSILYFSLVEYGGMLRWC